MSYKIFKKLFLVLLFASISFFADCPNTSKPLSVLIIGGGPAGLATAIEAKESGAQVTIVEKRSEYVRLQRLFLFDSSIQLLEKWQIVLPNLHVTELEDGSCIGVVSIRHLEEGLERRVKELGIQKIQGEFRAFSKQNRVLIATAEKEEQQISYDIVVGADGAHSSIKEALGIKTKILGSAKGCFAFLLDPDDPSKEMTISSPAKIEGAVLRKIKAPFVSILFMQSPENGSKEQLQKMITELGWQKEAFLISKGQGVISTDIPITLQQALTFSNQEKCAILVGDASATASFFQGMGANTALKTAEKAGHFFKEVQRKPSAAYQNYNQALKNITDALIEDSAFLFTS